MQARIIDLKSTIGDTFQFDFKIKDPETALTDAFFTIKKNLEESENVLQLSIGEGIEAKEINIYRVVITSEQAELLREYAYYYDLKLFFNENSYTPIKGKFYPQWKVYGD